MKLTINRKALLSALGEVQCAVARTPNPLSECVRLRVGDSISATADCGEMRATVTIDAPAGSEPGEVVVDFHKLMSLLSRDAETVELESKGQSLGVKLGGLRATVPGDHPSAFPSERKADGLQAYIMATSEIGKQMVLCAINAGDGKSHAWNPGLCIEDTGSSLYICATDGRTFGVSRMDSTECGLFRAVIAARAALPIAKRIVDADSVSFSVYPDRVSFTIDNVTIDVAQMSIPYANIIPTYTALTGEHVNEVTVETKRLLSAARTANAQLGIGEFAVHLRVTAAGIIVSTLSKRTGAAYEEAIAFGKPPTNTQHYECHISPKFLITHLAELSSEFVTIGYGNDARTLSVTSDGSPHKWLCALMTQGAE